MDFRAAALLSALTFPTCAASQTLNGAYVSGDLGAGFTGSLRTVKGLTKAETDVGPVASGSVGWGMGHGFRAELEGSYGSDNVHDIYTRRLNGALEPLTNVDGRVAQSAILVNVLEDLPTQRFRLPFRVYVGAGLGYGWLDFNGTHGGGLAIIDLPQSNTFQGPVRVRFGGAGALAYQAIGGVSWRLPAMRGVELTAEYRFLAQSRTKLAVTRTATGGMVINGATPSSVAINEFSPQSSALTVGARWRFGP